MRVQRIYPAQGRPEESFRAIAEAVNRLADVAPYEGIVTVSSDADVNSDFGFWIGDSTGGNVVMNVPPAEAHKGKSFTFKKIDGSANEVQVTPTSGMVDGAASVSLTSQWDAVTITSDGDNWLITARVS